LLSEKAAKLSLTALEHPKAQQPSKPISNEPGENPMSSPFNLAICGFAAGFLCFAMTLWTRPANHTSLDPILQRVTHQNPIHQSIKQEMQNNVPRVLRDTENEVPKVLADMQRHMLEAGMSPDEVREQLKGLEEAARKEIRDSEPEVRRLINDLD